MQAQGLADEFLPAAAQGGKIAAPSGVEHGLGADDSAVGQGDAGGRQPGGLRAGQHGIAKPLPDMGVEPRRGNAIIRHGKLAAVAGEADLIALRPAMGDQRFDQPAIPRIHVAVEEGPDMIAAQPVAAFQQTQGHIRTARRKGERGQAAGKAAAHYRQVAIGHGRHRPLVRRCAGKCTD